MNAALAALATGVVAAFRRALAALGIAAPFCLSQNDGTSMSAAHAERYPVPTFASGPTNSMRGAAFLSRCQDAVAIDIGGIATDVGVLARGFLRESALAVNVGGVRTNFRMPDVLAIGLGGGSLVRDGDPVSVGPDSVAFELAEKVPVFGPAYFGIAEACTPIERLAVEQDARRAKTTKTGARSRPAPRPLASPSYRPIWTSSQVRIISSSICGVSGTQKLVPFISATGSS